MTIRINLTDGTFVDTDRHTLEAARFLKASGYPITTGGPEELGVADHVNDDGSTDSPDVPDERTIQPGDIALIEQVPS